MNIKLILTSLSISSCLLLAGCATPGQTRALGDGPTMAQSYHYAMGQSDDNSLSKLRAQVNQHTDNSSSDWQSNVNISAMFPTLPNPPIYIYVYPHLAGPNEVPIPGYVTKVPMYTHTYYAMPGEMGVNNASGN